jgi:hypothetical protein
VSIGELGSWFFNWVTRRFMNAVLSRVCDGALVGVVAYTLADVVVPIGSIVTVFSS